MADDWTGESVAGMTEELADELADELSEEIADDDMLVGGLLVAWAGLEVQNWGWGLMRLRTRKVSREEEKFMQRYAQSAVHI